MSMFNDILWGSEDNEQECELSAELVLFILQKDSHQDDGRSSDLDQKRSGILFILTDYKEKRTESLN